MESLCLAIEGNKKLTIDGESLILTGSEKRTGPSWKLRKPACTTEKSIPLYNLLWAELSGKKLVLDYANQTSKKSLICKQWRLKVSASQSEHESDTYEDFVPSLLARAYGEALQKKRAYVLINPNSGSGGALKKWRHEVEPLFRAARMKLEIVILSRGGQAMDLVEQMDINEFDTITACSGDGTPHEIFNGLAKRPDAGIVLQRIPVSHIPCGSANALSYNLYESRYPAFAALGIIKGIITPLDLISITQGDTRIMSFLSQALGILAEADLATEHLRWMGNNRFNVGVALRVFRRKCYPCDIAVKIEMNDKAGIVEFTTYYSNNNEDKLVSGYSAENSIGDSNHGLPMLKYGTIKDPIPDSWTVISDDKVGNFYCGNMPYVGPDVGYFPAAIDSDGNMDMVTMNGDLSVFKPIKALLSIGSPGFFNNPHVKYKKISAYRITPRDQEDGYISIDGERVPFEPFQAEIHRRLGRVLSKPARLNTVRLGML